ncbi:hypothetical protein [Nonomuraea sp. SYSU D8015]|uniref:hypothetical protein n=1 Tax=Nonomuraea sp. SYSU D8015 TaxID=2593644 RepID=UPI0016610E29|nr:hypothetical protein [Nonomuraea sp. SYSU D8015]
MLSVADKSTGSKVRVTKTVDVSKDTKQQWKREVHPGRGITYTNVFSDMRLTYRPQGGFDFEQWPIGIFNEGQSSRRSPSPARSGRRSEPVGHGQNQRRRVP